MDGGVGTRGRRALHHLLPSIDQVWFNPHLILKYKDWRRFLVSPFYHLNESHLVYNMFSLLWKGVQLESLMGSTDFASMGRSYYYEYSVGFSGVLFALKVVLNAHSENYSYVHGILAPSRYAAWAELILIQMFVPGVSFLGHLGGILAGLLYLHLKGIYSGSDPLALMMRGIGGILRLPMRFLRSLFGYRRRRTSGRGTVGGGRRGLDEPGLWRCWACTYDNSGWLDDCEMCGSSCGGCSSPLLRPSSPLSDDLSLEELRRRRVERFGR
ncbi:hypothetical protein MLD38_023642 [Melastoma candidum]|uniref:Uncharacterized protein n=1 Tax=Melastoma candidum TaxID=119954 RepID=A0ACB9NT74_9MYRT|nr:hypothetical protein MLD38_023642 [Melastoma candidum]